MRTHVNLAFADGIYCFALGLAQIHELQTKCNVGIGGLFARVLQGRVPEEITVGHPAYAAYYIDDLVETVRQGLIGGGLGYVDGAEVKVGPLRANALVERYLHSLPLMDQWELAAQILHGKVNGYDGPETKVETEKKSPGAATTDGSITPEPSPTAP